MAKVVVVRVNGMLLIKEVDLSNDLKQYIDTVQSVPFGQELSGKNTAAILCDDNGKVNGLKINILATTLFHNIHPIGLDKEDILVGEIIVVGLDQNNNFTDVPEWFINKIKFLMR